MVSEQKRERDTERARNLCPSRKVPYKGRVAALKAARQHGQKFYKCQRCPFWHLANR